LTFFVQSNGIFGPLPTPGETTPLTGAKRAGGTSDPVAAAPATGFVQAQAQYVVAEPSGCHVATNRELFIRHLSVVEDPVRTVLNPADAASGAWSFGRLMERLSKPADAPAQTEAVFRSFLSPQVVNGFSIEPRPLMDPLVLQSWPRTPDGQLDLARAPLRLLAIVNRLDLEDASQRKAGEERFVYGVLDSVGNPLEFTVILEYNLPAGNESEARAWRDAVHALQSKAFPSAEYNAALQALTDRVTARGAQPGAPNGSALIDLRTNEIALGGIWQLREFRLAVESGLLTPTTLFQTPDFVLNNSDLLGRFINQNEASILSERHAVPLQFEGAPFATGSVFNNIDFWSAPGVKNPEARHKFSLNTCNGCHGGETQTGFLHVQPRVPGQESGLSGFLVGTTVFDPITGAPRELSELKRRRQLLQTKVCGTP
jgi:hypothetical protein